MHDKRGLIALAATGCGCEPRGVRFHEDAVERHAGGNIAKRLRLGIGEIAGKRNQEAKVQRAASLVPATAKAVHDSAKSSWPPMFLQNLEKIVPCVGGLVRSAAMDQDGPLARFGDLKLADETIPLLVARSTFVIVVESDFAAGDHFRLGQEGIEFGQGASVGFGGVMGIDSCAGVKPWKFGAVLSLRVELAANVERLMHFDRPLANADGEDDTDACSPCTEKHGLTIVRVARAVQVGVRVDQQWRLMGCMGKFGSARISLVQQKRQAERVRTRSRKWAARLPSEQQMRAKPKLGQNFLVDIQAAQRIAAALGEIADRTIVEIGPGRGAITGALASKAGHVVAVELDRELAAGLREQFDPARVKVVEDDVLRFNFAAEAARAGSQLRVAGNLPYAITSPILLKLAASHAAIDVAVLMVQREVAERVTATPGTRDYGLLSATMQMYGPVELLFTLPPSAFSPPPKVHSTVFRWRFAPRFAELGVAEIEFFRFLRQIFAQKRKTLANNLRAAGVAPGAVTGALAAAGIDPLARAEAVPVEALAALWRRLNER